VVVVTSSYLSIVNSMRRRRPGANMEIDRQSPLPSPSTIPGHGAHGQLAAAGNCRQPLSPTPTGGPSRTAAAITSQ